MTTAPALHSAKTAEHYTQEPWVSIAREAMGSIDLDPASCAAANELVKASHYYTAGRSGLDREWFGNVFLNPPGRCGGDFQVCGAVLANGNKRRMCSCKLVQKFWTKATNALIAGEIEQLFWVGFSIHQLQSLQACDRGGPIKFATVSGAILFPKKRVPYTGNAPTHPSYMLYAIRGGVDFACGVNRFEKAIEGMGELL